MLTVSRLTRSPGFHAPLCNTLKKLTSFAVLPAVLLSALFTAQPALALEGPWVESEYMRARLITPQTASGKSATLDAALEIELQPRWHMYWRMPGDGGLPPRLLPGDSQNLKNVEIQWPTPHRFEMDGLYGFGYRDNVTLPLSLSVEKPGEAVALALSGEIMVCENICVPQKLSLTLEIPAAEAKRDAQAAPYEAALKNLPFTENRPDMKIENVVMGPEALVVRAYLAQGFEGADLFVEGPEFYVVEKPQITPDAKDPRYASLVVKTPEGENIAKAIVGKTLTLTLVNKKGQGLERRFDF